MPITQRNNPVSRRTVLAAVVATLAAPAIQRTAQAAEPVRIGSLADLPGRTSSTRPSSRPMYLMRVKTPAELTSKYDIFDIKGTIPPEEAWKPLSESACPFIRKT